MLTGSMGGGTPIHCWKQYQLTNTFIIQWGDRRQKDFGTCSAIYQTLPFRWYLAVIEELDRTIIYIIWLGVVLGFTTFQQRQNGIERVDLPPELGIPRSSYTPSLTKFMNSSPDFCWLYKKWPSHIHRTILTFFPIQNNMTKKVAHPFFNKLVVYKCF